MAARIGRCWGCGKSCQGEFCDAACIVLWRDAKELNVDVPDRPATDAPIPIPKVNVSEHMRVFHATDGYWYVEFDMLCGKLYCQTATQAEANMFMKRMRDQGHVTMYKS